MKTPPAQRLVLVPTVPVSSSRGDELVRRYRLARVRLAGRERSADARRIPPARGG
jgi:hypothetical protein